MEHIVHFGVSIDEEYFKERVTQRAVEDIINSINAPVQPDSNQWSKAKKALNTIDRQLAINVLQKHLMSTDVPVSYPGLLSAIEAWNRMVRDEDKG